MNNWYNNSGTNVSLEQITPDNKGWRIENTLNVFGGSNLSVCQEAYHQYRVQVKVVEKSAGTNITLVLQMLCNVG